MARELLGIALAGESGSLRLTAIRDALDRTGITKPTEVVVGLGERKPYEEVFDGIGTELTREQSRAARGFVRHLRYFCIGFLFIRYQPAPAEEVPNPDPAREREAQGQGAATQEPAAPPVRHIVGDEALRVAALLQRQQRAIGR